jgi:hypothetical protein
MARRVDFAGVRIGRVATFDPPKSAHTISESIESSADEGAITGEYAARNFIYHGFIRIR